MIERSRVRIPAGAAGYFCCFFVSVFVSCFLVQGQLSVLLLFRYPFHPRVTAVASVDLGHSAKSAGGRLHAPYVCGFA